MIKINSANNNNIYSSEKDSPLKRSLWTVEREDNYKNVLDLFLVGFNFQGSKLLLKFLYFLTF